MVLVSHLIWQDHIIKESSNIMGMSTSSLVTILQNFRPYALW